MTATKLNDYTMTVLIASGASVSDAVDLIDMFNTERAYVAAIEIPASWTTATLTVQAGDSYTPVSDAAGSEYTISAAASKYIPIDPSAFFGVKKFKLVSGTLATPVTQGANRTIKLYIMRS